MIGRVGVAHNLLKVICIQRFGALLKQLFKIFSRLFVAAEVNEFVVYLVGFIDWVLVHTEKLITSFSILYLVRRIPKYRLSSELLLIWMAMGQAFC